MRLPSLSSLTHTRRALLVLALGGFGIGTGEFVMLGLLPEVSDGLHVSIPQAGYLISAYALGVVVGAPTVTAFTSHLPRKGLLIGLAAALAAGNIATALVPSFDAVLALRFLSGLPHGAYFGVASVAASSFVDASRRSQAMAVVFAGLTTANVVGVPLTTFAGQHLGWRPVFVGVALVEILAAALIAVVLPRTDRAASARSALRGELNTFRTPPVWLALGIATIGGGALFATFSYIAPMMTHVAGFATSSVTWLMVLFGLGMTAGNLVGARLADRKLMPTIYGALSAEVVIALAFLLTSHNEIAAAFTIFAFPATSMAMLPALQARIVALGGGAPNLASASIHAAFNIANSLGAWLGGAVIAAGFGYSSPNAVAAALALLGLGVAAWSAGYDRRAGVRLHGEAAEAELATAG
ncbi:MFS transporter [uncultured Jatrophihabitans sp.]|uniref:MFS transporter n=1 Tax=uncultured Jatrophihabitans sp. TaxID=1610747 RepID=UPI0035C9B85C